MSTVRFIHTADLHLGAPLLGIPWDEKLSNAVNDAFDSAIDEAIKRNVDFFIISGDIFDRSNIAYEDYKFFVDEISKLRMPVYICSGNHDPYESWQQTKSYGKLPDNVNFFPANKVKSYKFKDCIISGKSFSDDEINFEATNEKLSIGVLHTGLETDLYIDSIKKDTLNQLGYKYWALGHVHKRDTYEMSNCTIAFPGCIQGLHINAEAPNGVNYVELSEDDCKVEFIPTAKVIWNKLEVDITGVEDFNQVIERCQLTGKNLCVRITLTGKTKLHKALTKNNLNELQNQLTTDDCYCQKIIDNTQAEYNEEALLNEGLFPSAVLKTSIDNLEEEKHKFTIPLNYELDLKEIETKAKQQALDILDIDE